MSVQRYVNITTNIETSLKSLSVCPDQYQYLPMWVLL